MTTSQKFEDLTGLVMSKACLNQESNYPIDNALQAGTESWLQSDADEQLLINVEFQQPVKLAALNFQGTDLDTAPKNIKVFINRPNIGFEEAEDDDSTQSFELPEEVVTSNAKTELKFVKFQRVNTVQVFISNNHGDSEITKLKGLQFFGTPTENSVLSDWKPKKG